MASGVYRPSASPLWLCTGGHFGEFFTADDERYQLNFGMPRPVIPDALSRR